MRQRGILADLHAGASFEAQLRVRGGHQTREVVLRHAFFERLIRRFVGLQRHGRRQTHQLELVGVLDHPAAGCYRRTADDFHAARGVADAITEHELDRLLDAQGPGGDAAVAQTGGDQRIGTLVLVPGADVGVTR